jgi:hypothetical protein
MFFADEEPGMKQGPLEKISIIDRVRPLPCRPMKPARSKTGTFTNTTYKNIKFIKSLLQWRFRCTWLKRLQQNEGNFSCA